MIDQYDTITGKYFDLLDEATLDVLVINEEDESAQKVKILDSLASKLYDSIVNKVDDIDFGSIPESRGDITKLDNYSQLLETIDVIDKISSPFNDGNKRSTSIQVILDAIDNVKSRTDLWEKAYDYDMQLPIIFYNTITLSIVSSISMIIFTSMEFIKDPSDGSYDIKFDNRKYENTLKSLLFQNLIKFNDSCKNGSLDKSMEYVLAYKKKQFIGADTIGIASVVAVSCLIVSIIPIMRELVFLFYNTRQHMSDYFAVQAQLLQVNSEYIKNNPDINASQRKEIAKKQDKVASIFKSLSNKLQIDMNTSQTKAKREADKDTKKYKVSDIEGLDIDPLSNTSSLF